MIITIQMNQQEYDTVLSFLLGLPMEKSDKQLLKLAYDWNGANLNVLEPLKSLRSRLNVNKLKAHLDERNGG